MFKVFKYLPIVFIVSGLTIFFFSCQKENLAQEKSSRHVTSRSDGGNQISRYNSTDETHKNVAKVISIFFQEEPVRASFHNFCVEKSIENVLLADYLFNGVLNDELLVSNLEIALEIVGGISMCDLFNDYLSTYPGIEISFLQEEAETYPEIINLDYFEVVSVYADIDDYPSYVNGEEVGSYNVTDEPTDRTILKLKDLDVYDVMQSNTVNADNFPMLYSDLLVCENLREYIQSTQVNPNNQKDLGVCVIDYPLGDVKVFKLSSIFDYYNANCGKAFNPPSADDFDFPDSLVIEWRSCGSGAADRDAMRNGKETVRDIRGKSKSVLRLCSTWCSWWDKECTFQLDVFIPTIASRTEFNVIGSVQKVFSCNEKRLRKGWFNKEEVPITEWLYLEGKHGDEWQYSLTGRNPSNGTTEERSVGFSLSSEIGFKVPGLGDIKLKQGGTMNNKITVKHNDCFLGSDIARYCNDLQEQISFGDLTAKLIEQ